jgi:hypothetical protein
VAAGGGIADACSVDHHMTMAKKPKADKPAGEKQPKETLGQRIHDHILAAEVAAEEAAGYGSVTVAVEAAEAAVVPEHELGHADDADDAATEGDEGKPAPKE